MNADGTTAAGPCVQSGSPFRSPLDQAGFSLVEVVIAIGVASFCLVVMLGLIPAGLNTNKDSSGETAAANIVRNISSDLRATAKTSTTTSLYSISFPSGSTPITNTFYFDESASTNSSNSPNSKYRATVVLTSNSPTITVWIGITWPAAASPSAAPGRYETVTAIDRRYP